MRGTFIALVAMPGVDLDAAVDALCSRLDLPGVLLDRLVADRAGRDVAQIVVDDGDAALRGLQDEAAGGLPPGDVVVGLGSGAVEAPAVAELLVSRTSEGGQVVLLDLPMHASARQAGLGAVSVPGLGPVRSTWRTLYEGRRARCVAVATATVQVEGLDPAGVAAAVEEVLRGRDS
jgi:shikimate kinase